MRLTTDEYKKQDLHYHYYTFTPQILTNENLCVEDDEFFILTAKEYKELGVTECLMEYAPNAECIST